MIRTSLLLGVLLAGAAVPADAQGTIRPGQTTRGELSSDDPTGSDDSHYDVWRFQAREGRVYGVTLRSEAFDAYLGVGRSAGDECDECEGDDDGGGGTDARVEFRAPESGTFEIRATSLIGGETGAYTLELEDLGERAEMVTEEVELEAEYTRVEDVEATPIRSGPTVRGELTETDARAEDDSFFDVYVYRGRAGESITISMSSEAFDTYLVVGRMDGEYEELDSNDDGPAGTDSFLRITLPEDGDYLIRANSLMGGETGPYTLRLTRD